MDAGRKTVDLHFEESGTGPAVLCVHGLASDRSTFAGQARWLAASYRCIRVDLRGHGASPVPPGPWRIADSCRSTRRDDGRGVGL